MHRDSFVVSPLFVPPLRFNLLSSLLYSMLAYNQPLHVTNGVPSSAYASTILPTATVTSSNAPPSSFFSNVGTTGHDSNGSGGSPTTPTGRTQPPSPLRESAQPPQFPRSTTAQTVLVRPLPSVPAGLPAMAEGTATAPGTPIHQQHQQQAPMLPPRPVVPTVGL
jgi:hypothetical protein